jgi:hypothetical protein
MKNVFLIYNIIKLLSIIIFFILLYFVINHKCKVRYETFQTKKYFVTFGSGGQKYIDAGKRLIKQANAIQLFDNVKLYTDKHLKNDYQFWKKHGNFILNNKRGYGYWIWKSYIIKKTMDELNNGDIILYLDCGCEININKKQKLIESFDYVQNDLIIGTYTQDDKRWNKMDLILYLDMNKKEYLNTPQHQAGALMILVNNKTRELVNKWYYISCNYHLIDDTPSNYKNFDCFKEHRHDQSIFSLLTKKYNIYSKRTLNNCIDILRNKSGISKLK